MSECDCRNRTVLKLLNVVSKYEELYTNNVVVAVVAVIVIAAAIAVIIVVAVVVVVIATRSRFLNCCLRFQVVVKLERIKERKIVSKMIEISQQIFSFFVSMILRQYLCCFIIENDNVQYLRLLFKILLRDVHASKISQILIISRRQTRRQLFDSSQ